MARHAGATRAEVNVAAGDTLVVEVGDDGRGPGGGSVEDDGGHGLPNLRARAERLGGTFHLGAGPTGGTRLVWTVPLRC